MESPIARIAVGVVCATLLSSLSLAQTVTKHVSATAKLPLRPLTVTALAPKPPINPGQHGIIFVGGHTQTLGDAALNPQPIPPGHPGLVSPPR